MKTYDPDAPVFGIHIPKTAGTTLKAHVEQWFAPRFYSHYFDEKTGRLPRRIKLKEGLLRRRPLSNSCVFGHFNKDRGFGIDQVYPGANQFFTVLRDPVELACSNYFFLNRVVGEWKDKSWAPTGSLDDYLSSCRLNMLNHFPERALADCENFLRQECVCVGVSEDLSGFIRNLASVLGKPVPDAVGRRNVTPRDIVPSANVIEEFRRRNVEEHRVYEAARRIHIEISDKLRSQL